jgi:hypothetical protein
MVAVPIIIHQQEALALRLWERPQAVKQGLQFAAVLRRCRWIGHWHGVGLLGQCLPSSTVTLFAPPPVERPVANNASQPCERGTFGGVIVFGAVPCLHNGFLQHLFSLVTAVEDARC